MPSKSSSYITNPVVAKDHRATINSGVAEFLDYLKNRGDRRVLDAARNCLDYLCRYATDELPHLLKEEEQNEFRNSGKTFVEWAPPGMLGLILDRFFRYHLMRELITTPEMRGYTANVVFHCLRWLGENKLLTSDEVAQITQVSDRLVLLGELSYEAATNLADSLNDCNSKPLMITHVIEFARHDVSKISGTKLWLEVWAPAELPAERNIGPIQIPSAVAKVLEPGWMIECTLGRVAKSPRWEILESGSIYPSLPFH